MLILQRNKGFSCEVREKKSSSFSSDKSLAKLDNLYIQSVNLIRYFVQQLFILALLVIFNFINVDFYFFFPVLFKIFNLRNIIAKSDTGDDRLMENRAFSIVLFIFHDEFLKIFLNLVFALIRICMCIHLFQPFFD